MSLRGVFGLGARSILATGKRTEGRVTGVKTCWWLKVNTKPARRHSLDGAEFPHIITFCYRAEGREYSGRRYISWRLRCPRVGEMMTVCHKAGEPSRYGVDTAQFGTGGGPLK